MCELKQNHLTEPSFYGTLSRLYNYHVELNFLVNMSLIVNLSTLICLNSLNLKIHLLR